MEFEGSRRFRWLGYNLQDGPESVDWWLQLVALASHRVLFEPEIA